MGHLTAYRSFFDYRNKEGGMVLTPMGQKPGMLWNVLQYTEQPWTIRIIWPKMPTVLRLRKCCRWSGLPKHWPPVVICLVPDRDGVWVLILRHEAQPPLQPLPELESWGLILMQLFSFMTKKGVEVIGAPVWKGTLPAQTDVYSYKKKLLESLFWTLLL